MNLADLFLQCGLSVSRVTPMGDVRALLDRLKAKPGGKLLRLGGEGDGSYWVPDDLSGIGACFSPGVANTSFFEEDLANRGIDVYLADRSVDRPPIEHPRFSFLKRNIASYSDDQAGLISLDAWHAAAGLKNPSADLLLQMDVEGSEYDIVHSLSQSLLCRFRIIVVEFHHVHQLLNCNHFGYMSRAFDKLLSQFQVCHIEENHAAGFFEADGVRMSRLIEITFHRQDRCR